MKKPENSCVNCPDRRAGCHAECEKYKEYVIAQEEYNQYLKERKTEIFGAAAPPPYHLPKSRWGRVLKGKRKR